MLPLLNKLSYYGKNRFYSLYSKVNSRIAISEVKRNFPDLSNLKNPFFIIGIPGSLCLVNLCLKYIPKDQKIVFVANGLNNYELSYAKKNLRVDDFVIINSTLTHGCVLDLLFDEFRKPFGILDYDCFVLDPNYFTQMKVLEPSTMMNAIYLYKNTILNIDFPSTYILFFNTKLILKIKQKYKVTSEITTYNRLSRNVKKKLNTIGVDQTHYPQEFKKYFDTLRVWYLLGLIDGLKCNFLERYQASPKPYNGIFHVGAGNSTEKLNNTWNTRGTYFWRKTLEACKDTDLQDYYYHRFGNMKSDDILKKVPELCEQIGYDFFNFVENVINEKS